MKIAAIGDNVIDRYMNVNKMFPGGNAVNVAAHARKLGAEAAYVGSLGADAEGKIIIDALKDLNVDLSQCIFLKDSTTKKCDINIIEGERSYLGADEGANWAHTTTITDSDVNYLKDFDLIHTSCNAKLHEDIYKLKDLDSMVTFDYSVKDKYRTDEFLELTCPYLELALFSCDNMTEEEIKELEKRVYSKGCKNVIATRGIEGQIFYNGKEFIEGKAKYVKAIDTMGAGDSFLAAVLVSLLEDGWKKGSVLSKVKIEKALEKGAEYSAKNCLSEGGFGYKVKLDLGGV